MTTEREKLAADIAAAEVKADAEFARIAAALRGDEVKSWAWVKLHKWWLIWGVLGFIALVESIKHLK